MMRLHSIEKLGNSIRNRVLLLGLAVVLTTSALQAQSGQNPPQQQPAQDIPDAPSAVQPPAPKPPVTPRPSEPEEQKAEPASSSSADTPAQKPDQTQPTPPPMPPIQTMPQGSQAGAPRNQINPSEDLYKISVPVNFVQIPVLVKSRDGRRVEGLLSRDFTVLENGKPQKLTFFTSDPFQLSVAILIDLGMADVTFQKVNQTYSSLVGAFSPYDEFALYTYSSTVSQLSDFTGKPQRLTAQLDQMKLVRARNNGPPVLGGPLGPQPPMVNGIPVGSAGPPPVETPPKEAHVLNDAILRAALDLSKRDRTRRKVILVVSDGRERGSQASYREVLRLLETHGIQVRAVVVDSGALPVFRQVSKLHLPGQGYSNVLPRYVNATGGGEDNPELSRNGIEDAYAQITADARNQYTLGYVPKAVSGGSAYRSIEVLVDKKGLDIYTKRGYYPVPAAR